MKDFFGALNARETSELVREEVKPPERRELAKAVREFGQPILAEVQSDEVVQPTKILREGHECCPQQTAGEQRANRMSRFSGHSLFPERSTLVTRRFAASASTGAVSRFWRGTGNCYDMSEPSTTLAPEPRKQTHNASASQSYWFAERGRAGALGRRFWADEHGRNWLLHKNWNVFVRWENEGR